MTSPVRIVPSAGDELSISVAPSPEQALHNAEPTDINAAIAHFERVFAHDHNGWAKFNFVDPALPRKRHPRSISLADPERASQLRQLLERFIETHECYMVYAVFRAEKRWNRAKRRPDGRRGKMEFQSKALLWYCRWAIGERDDHTRGPDVPIPSFTVRTSAGRYQDWYELAEPVSGDTVEDINRRLAHGSGFGHEAVDCVHPLRLAGTRNHKPERRGAVVRIAEECEALFLPEDFQHLPLLPRRDTPRTTFVTVPAMPLSGSARGARLWQDVRPRLSERMVACANGASVAKTNGERYRNRRAENMALLDALMAAGLDDDDEVAAAFLATPRGQRLADAAGSAKVEQRLAGTIATVRAWREERENPLDERFISLDPAILHHTEALGPPGVAILAAIASHGERAFPPQRRIGELLDRSVGYVQKHIAAVLDSGLVCTKPKGRGRAYLLVRSDAAPIWIPTRLLTECRNVDAVATYVVIAGRAAAGTSASQQEIAEALGVRRQRINAAVTMLETTGYVELAERRAHGQKVYRPCARQTPAVGNMHANYIAPPPPPAPSEPRAQLPSALAHTGAQERQTAGAARFLARGDVEDPVETARRYRAEGRSLARRTGHAIFYDYLKQLESRNTADPRR